MLCISICLIFTTSCDDDAENPQDETIESLNFKIEVNVEDGREYDIDKVKALLEEETEIASVDYNNGIFVIEIPETAVKDQNLINITDIFFDVPSEIAISEPNAKGTYLSIFGYKDDEAFGEFWHHKYTDTRNTSATFVYVDRDLTIIGSAEVDNDGDTFTDEYSLDLKKGWNIFYHIYSESSVSDYKTTTEPQSGMKWYFEDFSSYVDWTY